MAGMVKPIEITGTSPNNWQEAADNALQKARKAVKHISGIQVTEMSATVENGQITSYHTTLKIFFGTEQRPS